MQTFGLTSLVFLCMCTLPFVSAQQCQLTSFSDALCKTSTGTVSIPATCQSRATSSIQCSCGGNVGSLQFFTSSTTCFGPSSLLSTFTGTSSCITDGAASFQASCAFPSSSGGSSSSTCFAGSNEVTLESGETKLISEVAVGDRVLAYSSKTQSAIFSDVVAVPHAKNNKISDFLQISTESGKTIKMTAEHLIQSGSCSSDLFLVAAKKVTIGDCVMTVDGIEKVSSSETISEEGLYTVVAGEDLLVVNKIIASPFAMNHFIPNMFYNIHRMLFNLMPSFLSSKIMTSVSTVAEEVSQFYTITKTKE